MSKYTIESLCGMYTPITIKDFPKIPFKVILKKILYSSKKILANYNFLLLSIQIPPVLDTWPDSLKLNIIGDSAVILYSSAISG